MTQVDSALARWLPRVAAHVPWASLGDWPTPIDELSITGAPLWVKREGDSSARYGGNKVRTLEAWLGHARASGARRIWAIGAYGSNHVVATVLHARAIGLESGAIVFPQPASEWAVENAGALIASGVPIVRLRNVVEVPFAGVAIAAQARLARTIWRRIGADEVVSTARFDEDAGGSAHDLEASPLTQVAGDQLVTPPTRTIAELARDAMTGAPASRVLGMLVGRELARDSIVMPPGGATPIGTLGALSAVFELAEQIETGVAPPPRRIVVPAGSTCTTAGLLSGFAIAHAIGAWRWPVPIVHAVRVTPWPVTSRIVIVRLAEATLARIALLGGPRVELRTPRLIVDASELGGGYGRVTDHGVAAMRQLASVAHAPRLDGVYSAKAAAALLRLHGRGIGPLLFWSTKATKVLSTPGMQALRAAPRALLQWLG